MNVQHGAAHEHKQAKAVGQANVAVLVLAQVMEGTGTLQGNPR
jgi:hypothetical protein